MTEQQFCILSIEITTKYYMKCSIETSDKQTTIITINKDQDEYIPLTIEFGNDDITIGNETEKSIYFMKDWIEHPEINRLYPSCFKNKQYLITAEIIFALIINQYRKLIEQNYIIDETIIRIPTNSKIFLKRIGLALESLGLKETENE